MADSWSKREREKKKQQQKKDKEEKKLEKKSSGKSGTSLDDMMAYVDEYGNISNTPPDPNKKKVEVKLEDIQIGVPKWEATAEEGPRTGIVSFFNESKGYGFIKDLNTQESIFVHANGLTEQIKENNKVSFEIEMTHKGPSAIQVKLVK
ncbi:MAG: cold shock domain-containing protein [Hydrotalea sp.]|jgi:cold shock CspA family protein|nr:cold shock domain-containing protein [Hydrotalea sp.]